MVAAAAAAVALSCRPEPGVGTLVYTRSGRQHALDLANCRDRVLQPGVSKPSPLFSPDGRFAATVVAKRNGNQGTNAIVVRNQSTGATRIIYRVPESYRSIPAGGPGPIMLFRWSADGRWLFFAIDPQGSASIAADGNYDTATSTAAVVTLAKAAQTITVVATGSRRPTRGFSWRRLRLGRHARSSRRRNEPGAR